MCVNEGVQIRHSFLNTYNQIDNVSISTITPRCIKTDRNQRLFLFYTVDGKLFFIDERIAEDSLIFRVYQQAGGKESQ